MLLIVYEMLVNIVGCFLQLILELKSIQENLGLQKLVDVKKVCFNGSFVGIRVFGLFDDKIGKFEVKVSNKNSRFNLGVVV